MFIEQRRWIFVKGAAMMSTADKLTETRTKRASPSFDEPKMRGTLTRQDLALAIFERVGGISRREAKRIVDGVVDEMVSTLVSGESLKLHDFGSFVVRDKHERSGRNPRTGAPVPIEARRVVVFKASPNMKATINGATPEKPSQKSKTRRAKKPAAQGAGGMPSFASVMDKA
jgi:integration host factor subunit alpha